MNVPDRPTPALKRNTFSCDADNIEAQTCNAQVWDRMIYNQHETAAENPTKVYIEIKNHDLNYSKIVFN